MAKHPERSRGEEIEVPFTTMRKIGPERFEVVSGVIRGAPVSSRVVDRNVSLMVGRLAAKKALTAQFEALSAKLGLEVPS